MTTIPRLHSIGPKQCNNLAGCRIQNHVRVQDHATSSQLPRASLVPLPLLLFLLFFFPKSGFTSSNTSSPSLPLPLPSPRPRPPTIPLTALPTPTLIPFPLNIFVLPLFWLSKLCRLGDFWRVTGVLGSLWPVPATSSELHHPSGREVDDCAVICEAFIEPAGESATV